MNQFIRRVANYVASEVIVKGLANSRTFQKFAVRTNKQYTETVKQGTEKINMTLEEAAAQQAGGTKAAAEAAVVVHPNRRCEEFQDCLWHLGKYYENILPGHNP